MIPLRDIRRRIKSVERIGHITRAMKTVSAIRLMKVQGQVLRQKPYATKLREMVGDLVARTANETHPMLKPSAAPADGGAPHSAGEPTPTDRQRIVCLALGSDRALCGAFNNNVTAGCLKFLDEHKRQDVSLIVFGKRLRDLLKSRRVTMSRDFVDFYRDMTYEKVVDLAAEYLKQYQQGAIGELWVVYTEFRSTARQRVTSERLLPIGLEELPAEPLFPEYTYEPGAFAVLDSVLPMYYNREVYRIFLESVASEHIARMLAMDMATVNAGDMIRNLTLSYNKARQEAITRELSEISTAAEAFRNR